MKILLCCSGGFSSSIIAQAVIDAGKKQGKTVECRAVSSGNVENYLDGVQVVLMGPQEGYAKPKVEQVCKPLGIPVDIIEHRAYGFCDGEAVLKQAEALVNK